MRKRKLFGATGILLILLVIGCDNSDNNDHIDNTGTLHEFAEGLDKPVGIVSAGDSRLFVIEQEGTIAVVDSAGNVDSAKFLDITDRVVYGGERGLLGLAFDPGYPGNGYFYINYIGENDSTHISRFSVMAGDPAKADPASEVKILTLAQPYENHNGGQLAFGPEGYLYIGLGDGGSSGDPENRAQNLSVLLGKILRIEVHDDGSWSTPPSNPFNDSNDQAGEIWAYGLRNPWRFSFDRLTGDLWIADVGQNQYEEINFQPANSTGGENYGWRCFEAESVFDENCDTLMSAVFPVYTYEHGTECSVTGGYVYRGLESSPYYGRYFFADFCSDKIWTIRLQGQAWVEEEFGHFPGNGFSTFGEDADGELYIAGLESGRLYRLTLGGRTPGVVMYP